MEALLIGLKGKKIDVNCGSNAAFRGEIVSVDGGLLKLKSEDEHEIYIAVDKIAAISECSDLASRPGFIV